MDGFRERLAGRYDRSTARGAGFDRSSDDRYEGDRYERAPRRGGSDVTQEAINEAINEAITKSNREQLDVIADFFDEAKADRMESERAIIDALSHSMSDAASEETKRVAASEPVTPIAVVDEQNAETLARIERIAGQNAEAINESSEMLERNVDSLRSNTELLNEIKNVVDTLALSSDEVKNSSLELRESVNRSLQEISSRAATPMQDITVDFTSEKDEIIGAVGDNRAILNMIRQDVLNGFAKTAQDEEEPEEKIIPLSADDADKYYKELEDHVHKECVKCYRNVQSALTEQNTEANNSVNKSVSGLRIMVLVSLLLNIITVALTVCNILGLFSF